MSMPAAAPEEDIVRANTGVAGAVVDKGSMQRFMPYFCQSVRKQRPHQTRPDQTRFDCFESKQQKDEAFAREIKSAETQLGI